MNKVPTHAEYVQLACDWQAADTIAEKNRLATIILQGLDKLIHKIVRRISNKFDDATHDDCYAEAQICIIKNALPNFKKEKLKDASFANYMAAWVYQAAKRYLDKTASTVSFPINGRQAALKARENGEELSVKQLARLGSTVYWDTPVKSGDGSGSRSLADVICANEGVFDSFNVIDVIQERHDMKLCQVLLDEPIHERSAYIVKQYLQGRIFPDIAKELGMSKSNARRLYSQHIDRLRKRVSLARAVKSDDGKHSQTSAETRIDLLIGINEKLKLEERGDSRGN